MRVNYKIIKEFTEQGHKYYHVETPYGICKQKVEKYKRGQKCKIMSALDKTEFFKNMCLLKFGGFTECFKNVNIPELNMYID